MNASSAMEMKSLDVPVGQKSSHEISLQLAITELSAKPAAETVHCFAKVLLAIILGGCST